MNYSATAPPMDTSSVPSPWPPAQFFPLPPAAAYFNSLLPVANAGHPLQTQLLLGGFFNNFNNGYNLSGVANFDSTGYKGISKTYQEKYDVLEGLEELSPLANNSLEQKLDILKCRVPVQTVLGWMRGRDIIYQAVASGFGMKKQLNQADKDVMSNKVALSMFNGTENGGAGVEDQALRALACSRTTLATLKQLGIIVANKDAEIAAKDAEIARLKDTIATVEANLQNCKQIDTSDLTAEVSEPAKKRPRTESAPAKLGETMVGDLDYSNGFGEQQLLRAADISQKSIDELASLVAAGQEADAAAASPIQYQSFARGFGGGDEAFSNDDDCSYGVASSAMSEERRPEGASTKRSVLKMTNTPPGINVVAKKKSSASKDPAASTKSSSSNTWECHRCQEVNQQSRTRCLSCQGWKGGSHPHQKKSMLAKKSAAVEGGKRRKDGKKPAVADGGKGKKQSSNSSYGKKKSPPDNDGEWQCHLCNETNLPSRSRCSACQGWKGGTHAYTKKS